MLLDFGKPLISFHLCFFSTMKNTAMSKAVLVVGALTFAPGGALGFTMPGASPMHVKSTTQLHSETVAESECTDAVTTDPKEAVKLFGRLADKYIMLDASAGMCCYSGCSDCEYREPGGGYRMADQSAARPKWIPVYDHREFASGKEHTSKWSEGIFTEGPAVTKEEFVERLVGMEFAPPLGGPYMSKSSAGIEDMSAAETLFDVLIAEGKEKLTKHSMGKRMKELADGEEGFVWKPFALALGAN